MNYRALMGRARTLLSGNTGSLIITAVIQTLLRIGGSVIMTRILPPEAFGAVAIITSVAVAFALLSDIGIIAFLIRHEGDISRDLLDEIWTIRLIRGFALSCAVAVFSWPIALLLAKPDLVLALAVGGLTFIFDGLDSLAMVTAIRNQQIKRLNKIEVSLQFASLLVGIALGLILHNYWALLASQFFSQLARAWTSYALFPGNSRRWRWSAARARELWGFSKYITASTIITLITTQADKFVFGRLLTLGQLGQYSVAGNISQAPVGVATSYAGRILFPRYAEMNRLDPQQLGHVFYQYKRLTANAYALASAGLITCAPLVTHILYTDAFADVAIYLQILMIGGVFALNNFTINELMIVRGKTSFTFASGLYRMSFLLVAGPILYIWLGAIGLVWTMGLVEIAALLFGWYTLWRIEILDVRRELEPLLCAAVGLALGFVANNIGLAALRAL
jgi:lipopolysaccharide exporter